jgi:pyrroloquinoline quinone biosynthesis protein B
MRIIVLGAAAGGGFPQWNCGCPNCQLVRAQSPLVVPATQDSIAVSANGTDYYVLNASPDIHRQIQQAAELWPASPRHTPIRGLVLSNGDMDHILGLFSLRESQPLELLATPRVIHGLFERNAMTKTLQRFEGQLTMRPLDLNTPVSLGHGMTVRAVPLSGKLPVHLEGSMPPSGEDNVALVVEQGGKRLVYATSCPDVRELLPLVTPDTTLVVDGTFYTEDELVNLGLSKARAKSMAHQPIAGEAGSLPVLGALVQKSGIKQIIYTHLNNTNPVLRKDSAERARVEAAGIAVAFDGMRLVL